MPSLHCLFFLMKMNGFKSLPVLLRHKHCACYSSTKMSHNGMANWTSRTIVSTSIFQSIQQPLTGSFSLICRSMFGGCTVHALKILDDLNLRKADDELIPENLSESKMRLFRTERECIRRTFWIIHLCEELASTFQRTRPPSRTRALTILLPCNETSFEMTTYEDLPRGTLFFSPLSPPYT